MEILQWEQNLMDFQKERTRNILPMNPQYPS